MRLFTAFLPAAVALVSSMPVAHASQQDFTLQNKTGYQIDEVYVSQSSSRNWGNDIMGRDALDDGNTVDISFHAPDDACRWDMRVKYNDGDEATWNNLNLCNISKVTLFWDRKNEKTRAVTE
jgi:hypothetical protein